jgi:hypothetical protein
MILLYHEKYVILSIGKDHEAGRLYPSFTRRAYKCPPDERKEGDSNVCYIFGFNSDRYTHCCPYQSVLSDLQGKKEIAATTTNSDGLPMPSHR